MLAPNPLVQLTTMSDFDYRTARAMYPFRPDLWAQAEYIYDPLPLQIQVPVDHPELNLFSSEIGISTVGSDIAVEDETTTQAFADPIPARMLNEFVYCPRLFYYEFVDGVFLESADTERGSAIHKKVDKGRGDLLPASNRARTKRNAANEDQETSSEENADAETTVTSTAITSELSETTEHDNDADPVVNSTTTIETDKIHSRSASLGSERLGVIAKMDLIEVQLVTVSSTPHNSDLLQPADSQPAVNQSSNTVTQRKSGKRSQSHGSELELDLFSSSTDTNTNTNTSNTQQRSQPAQQTLPSSSTYVQKVTPVDYKLGSPRMGDHGVELWDADKMQLGLQILVLRDNGYACDDGVIYYRETRQRVPLIMTDELESWIIHKISEAREIAVSRIKPEPLFNSPKCVRCSLAPICLPDETRFMKQCGAEPATPALNITNNSDYDTDRLDSTYNRLARFERNRFNALKVNPPRRLIAAGDQTRALYLNTQGARVTVRSEVLVVKEEKTQVGEYRLKDLSHVALFGNIQITTQAIQTLCEAEIPVAYFSMGGWFYGLTRGHGLKNVFTRIEQLNSAQEPMRCLALAQRFVHGKIRNHRTQLMRNHTNLPEGVALKLKRAAGDALSARSIDTLLGIEGAAASMYFQHFSGMIKVSADDDDLPGLEAPEQPASQPDFTFDFTKRSRRPPADPVNALLSLAYSLLAKDCTLAALAVGFDPYVGFYHQPRHGRPALALDLMEEFRPLIAESAVLTALNNRMINASHFVKAGDAVNLNAHGRKIFFQAYEARMKSVITHPVFDYKASYRRIIELQARMLARYLTGEIAEYVPMMTR